MLSSGHWLPDEDGEFFIDRNPKVFGFIIDYLRTGERINTNGWSEGDIKILKDDLAYYLIEIPKLNEIIPQIPVTWCKEYCGVKLQVTEQTITKIPGTGHGWNASALGSIPNLASFKFTYAFVLFSFSSFSVLLFPFFSFLFFLFSFSLCFFFSIYFSFDFFS